MTSVLGFDRDVKKVCESTSLAILNTWQGIRINFGHGAKLKVH